MEKFSAQTYFKLGWLLSDAFDEVLRKGDAGAVEVRKRWNDGKIAVVSVGLCKGCGLTISAKCAEEIGKLLASDENISAQMLIGYLAHFQKTIGWEMEEQVFLHMPLNAVKFYDPKEPLFGKDVAERFPRLTEDISEAGKCFGVARYTAAVFHLMRVMEITVQLLAAKVGVKLPDEKNWQVILDQFNGVIKSMPNRTSRQKKKQAEYAAASAHLFNVKLAWRNPVMHPKETYTENEASDIFASVKAWTRSLLVLV